MRSATRAGIPFGPFAAGVIFGLLAAMPPGFVAAAESQSEAARIQAAQELAQVELEAEKKALQEDADRFGKAEAALRKILEDLLSGTETRLQALEEKEGILGGLEKEVGQAEIERAKALADEADLRTFFFEKIEGLRNRIELGVPHAGRPARLSRLRTLEIAASDPGADLAEIIGSYSNHALEEIDLGASCELYATGVITSEGNIREADILRFGKVFSAYRTKDGRHAALLVPGMGDKGGFEWRDSIDAGDAVETALNEPEGLHLVPLDVTLDIASDRIDVSKDLLSTLLAGGLVMVPLALVALASLLLLAERAVVLVRSRSRAPRLERDVIGPLRRGDRVQAREACALVPGPAALVLLSGLDAVDRGKNAVEEAIEEKAVRVLPRLERFSSALAALAAVAPLLGLLGTVTGMISTFDVITIFGTGDPRLLSGGISEALITTQVGLMLAIPLLLAHRVIVGVVERRILAIETLGVAMVNALFHGRSTDGAEGSGLEEGKGSDVD